MTDDLLADALKNLSAAMPEVLADMEAVVRGQSAELARERLTRSAPIAAQAARRVVAASIDYRALALDAEVFAQQLDTVGTGTWKDPGLFASIRGRFRPLQDAALNLDQGPGETDAA